MQRWNQNFDHEAPARLQMRGNVLEARVLAALGVRFMIVLRTR